VGDGVACVARSYLAIKYAPTNDPAEDP